MWKIKTYSMSSAQISTPAMANTQRSYKEFVVFAGGIYSASPSFLRAQPGSHTHQPCHSICIPAHLTHAQLPVCIVEYRFHFVPVPYRRYTTYIPTLLIVWRAAPATFGLSGCCAVLAPPWLKIISGSRPRWRPQGPHNCVFPLPQINAFFATLNYLSPIGKDRPPQA